MATLVFRLTIRTDGDAFSCGSNAHPEDPQECGQMSRETARILREIAKRLDQGDDFAMYRTIFDANGNDVGRAAFKPEPESAPPTRGRRNRS
jgi:hypothetical protein